ncbi:synaptic vesicle glycoprotein 2B isoform X2 [Neodiprion pinetum]|uniref:synaptic vesicle glycoprotein 2B isoform X2 n=1 Tax=Neodiprion pinetum TaxID=441929 RepID=UPI001EDDE286|nr:synaptic vesicle glycoprotein 2B-like isoform X2 [Neodiprion pinetum]
MEVNGDRESVPRIPENECAEAAVDFETAVSATGYGLFNVLLLMAAIPAGWTTVFDTSTTAFIMPSAECELDLSLFRKGLLAASTYAGMICIAVVWGFIADHIGRKYLLLFGLISDTLCNVFGSAAQSYYVYLSFKFTSGIIVGGPFAILMTYIAEFHGERHRSRVLMWTGSLFALGNVAVPALSRAVLPRTWSFSLFNNSLIFDAWRIFLLICALPPFLGFVAMWSFPESPKFLMTKGRSEEALKVFRRMYSMNTGKPEDDYPVKILRIENVAKVQTPLEPANRSSRDGLRRSFYRMKFLFPTPYIFPLFTINVIIFASMTGMHVMKSWLPQLIVILNNFDPKESDDSPIVPTICEKLNVQAIEAFGAQAALALGNTTETCIPMIVSTTVYTNATIIAASAVTGSFLVGAIVNKVGKKSILLVSLVSGGSCYLGLSFSPSTTIFLVLCSAIIALTGISTNAITSMIIEVVPTSLRATAVSVTLMTGRFGALTGNLLFPLLLNVSCDAPFYYIGGFLTLCFVLAIFLSKYSGKLP